MQTIHISKPDPFYTAIVAITFPAYNGKKFRLEVHAGDFRMNLNSYWDGGSRNSFRLLELATMKSVGIPQNGTMFDGGRDYRDVLIPAGIAVVVHSVSCGKDAGITIHISEANATKLLPPMDTGITDNEKIVLAFTARYKNSYAGASNCRYKEASRVYPIGLSAWESAKDSCITKGLLNKAGAITPEGRNIDVSEITGSAGCLSFQRR
jgi:hypothetical protein